MAQRAHTLEGPDLPGSRHIRISTSALALGGLFASTVLVGLTAAPAHAASHKDQLGKHDKELVAHAVASGARWAALAPTTRRHRPRPGEPDVWWLLVVRRALARQRRHVQRTAKRHLDQRTSSRRARRGLGRQRRCAQRDPGAGRPADSAGRCGRAQHRRQCSPAIGAVLRHDLDQLGRAQPRRALVRHGSHRRAVPARPARRHRRRQPGPVHRQHALRRAGREHLQPELLHQPPARCFLRPEQPDLRIAAPGHLGVRRGGNGVRRRS